MMPKMPSRPREKQFRPPNETIGVWGPDLFLPEEFFVRGKEGLNFESGL